MVRKQISQFKQNKSLFENFFPGSNWKINFSSEGHKCSSYLRKFQINKRDFSSEKVLFTILGTSLESTLLLMMEILLKVQTLTLARQTWIKISFRGGMVWGRKREKGTRRAPLPWLFFPFFFLPLFLLSSNLISGSTPHDTGKLRLAKYVQVEIRT